MSPIFLYRIAHWLYKHHFPIVPKLITFFIRFFYSCYIPHTAEIGSNILLGYGGLGIVIHGNCVIGNDCHINQQVTLGGTSKKKDVPRIGNRVYVGAGAKIIGPVSIGDDVVIGANAVVVSNVASNSLVAGIPAKVIKEGIKMSDYV